MKDKKLNILVAAGGTGGHLFPALAVVEQLEKMTSGNINVEFVGNASRIEGRILPQKGYKLHDMPISGFGGLSLKTLALPFKIMKSTAICRNIIENFKPDAVLAAGAYISYPAGKAAANTDVPLFLMESNVFPGKTIKMLASRAKLIFTAFEESERYFDSSVRSKLFYIGNPVRQDIGNPLPKAESREKFGLERDKKTVLIFGGSLGARSINNATSKTILEMQGERVQFLWQTGKNFKYEGKLPENVKLFPFIEDMASAYSSADLVISRAGATSVAEICVAGKPSILVPYPDAANNHQEYNALILHENGAALMLNDSEVEEVLTDTLNEYLFDDEALAELASAAKSLAKPLAAEQTAKEILKKINW